MGSLGSWLHLRPKSLTTNYPLLKVADLIDPINNCWFEEKLLKLFDEGSINAIKRIVILAAPSPNKLVWILDAKRKFSVKSAFNINHAPMQIVDESLWSQLWKLKIHDRYKLVWRIATGILPTRLIVAQKLGAGDSSYPLCQDCEESIDHLFFKCSVSRAIWFGISQVIHSSLLTISSSQDILKFICNPCILFDDQHKTKVLLEQTSIQFATTLDSIWTLRNKVVHENFKFNILVQIGNLEVRIAKHIQALVESADVDDSICSKVWNAPPLGTDKLNVDARIRVDQASIAVVARNHRGFIIKAWAKLIDFSDPTMAEAVAITWALELAVIEKFEHICIESDAKVCVDALAAPIDDCLWKIRALVSMSLKLALKFSSCNFH